MPLAIHYFDSAPFIATPYRPGSYIREDVFWRQLTVTCQGEIEYPEDDPIYGTFWRAGSLHLGHCGLIEQAMSLAQACLYQHRFEFNDEDDDALDFRPHLFHVRDRHARLVLAGEVRGGIRWCPPVASDAEAQQVTQEIRRLQDEAAFEHGWDNYSTAKNLRLRADVLHGRLVDRFWRAPARKAIEQHTPS